MDDLELIDKVRKYLQPPSSISKMARDTLREDLAIQLIDYKLKEGDISILDVGCGTGVILAVLRINFKNQADKISYHGIDQNDKYIEQLKYTESKSEPIRWKEKPRFTVGKILDYQPNKNELYDIIFVLNFIHEFDPIDIIQLIAKINSMLKENGTIAIIDMEKLPEKEKEVKEICFKSEEIENIMKSMGIKDIPTTHRKSVNVFSLNIKKFKIDINEGNCLQTIQDLLEEKLNDAMGDYNQMLIFTSEWDNDCIYKWIWLSGYICRLNECLQKIKLKLKVIGNNMSNQT